MRNFIKRTERFFIYRVLHADDTPHRLALGIAVGMFCAWLPIMGFQMAATVVLASFIRANRIVGLPVVWVSNPLTAAPIYFANYWFGNLIMNIFRSAPAMTYQEYQDFLGRFLGVFLNPSNVFSNLFEAEFWRNLARFLADVSWDLWLGSLIMGLFLGGLAYIVSYRSIVWYRLHTPRGRRHSAWLSRRKQRDNNDRASE